MRADGGNLLVAFPGQRPIEFMPQSPDSFAGWIDATIRFDLAGEAPVLVVSQNGAEIVCPRARLDDRASCAHGLAGGSPGDVIVSRMSSRASSGPPVP